MKHVLLTLLLLISMPALAATTEKPLIITVGTELLEQLPIKSRRFKTINKFNTTAILQASEVALDDISTVAETQGKCGGYFVHETIEDARRSITDSAKSTPNRLYTVRDLKLVRTLLPKVQGAKIEQRIRRMSAYHNRYYKSETGVNSAKDLKTHWEKYTPTELYVHKGWPQPSVIATITGSKYPDQVIIIGGHLDSIAGFFGGSKARAPGADDNASGIATTEEVLRVISKSKYKPLRTIKFMGYAAEEVGLRGSNEIAKDFKSKGINVIGVMQLDMTNFKGSDKAIYLTTDYTNESQTKFLGELVGTYLKVPFGTTKCGYACSDHASWHKAGYPAVFPFEAAKGNMNKKIHTSKDVIEVSGGNASHATNFAKLALAYLIELDLQGADISLENINL